MKITILNTAYESKLNRRTLRKSGGNSGVRKTKDKLPLDLVTYIALSEKHKTYNFEN